MYIKMLGMLGSECFDYKTTYIYFKTVGLYICLSNRRTLSCKITPVDQSIWHVYNALLVKDI